MRTSLFRSATAAVKNTLPAALLLGFLSLAFTPAARAQLTFTVNEFTANSLSLTIHAGSLLTTNGPEDEGAVELILSDASGSNGTWINSDVALSGGGNFGSISQSSMRANDSANDAIELQWEDDLSSVGELGTDLTYTVASTGLFNPDNVSSWRLT